MEDKKTIEENFEQLGQIISEMQSEEITLEQSFTLYKRGLEMIKDCNGQIEKIEKEIKVIEEDNVNV